MIWDPVFSPDGEQVLAKAEQDGQLFHRFVTAR